MMILHDDVPRRLSARALAPVAVLAAAAFSGFSFAQERERAQQDPERRAARRVEDVDRRLDELLRRVELELLSVRGARAATPPATVDIRVGGRALSELDDEDFDRLGELGDALRAHAHGRRIETRERDRREQDPSPRRAAGLLPGMLQMAIRSGLDEARKEIRDDEDLRRMGLTDEVGALIDSIAGHGAGSPEFDRALGEVIQQGLRSGIEAAKVELRQDAELRELGLDRALEGLLDGLVRGAELRTDELSGAIGGLVRGAMQEGLREAREGVRTDEDLLRLGLSGDVDRLLRTLEGGAGIGSGEFAGALEGLIQRGVRAGLDEARTEIRAEGLDPSLVDALEGVLDGALRGDLGADDERELQRALKQLIEQAERRQREATPERRRTLR